MHVIKIFCGIVLQIVHLYNKYFNSNLYSFLKYLSSLRFYGIHSSFEGMKVMLADLKDPRILLPSHY